MGEEEEEKEYVTTGSSSKMTSMALSTPLVLLLPPHTIMAATPLSKSHPPTTSSHCLTIPPLPTLRRPTLPPITTLLRITHTSTLSQTLLTPLSHIFSSRINTSNSNTLCHHNHSLHSHYNSLAPTVSIEYRLAIINLMVCNSLYSTMRMEVGWGKAKPLIISHNRYHLILLIRRHLQVDTLLLLAVRMFTLESLIDIITTRLKVAACSPICMGIVNIITTRGSNLPWGHTRDSGTCRCSRLA